MSTQTVTTEPAAAVQPSTTAPEFIRLPRSGQPEPRTGLSRSALNDLILPNEGNGFKPSVKSICLRKRGAARGCRLIVWESLRAYLYSQSQEA